MRDVRLRGGPRRVLAMAAAALAIAAPAAAHPFGPPPTARVTIEGRTVAVHWTATPDDAVAIGESLGVMPPGSVAAYRQDAASQVAPSRVDEARLSASPQLREYLRTHITATQDGRRCSSTPPTPADFVHEGVVVTLRCPAPVDTVSLRITMLHALHPAYRTVAVDAGGGDGQAVFTVAQPEHPWPVRGGGLEEISPVAVTAGLLAAAAMAYAWHRRRR